MKMEIRKYIFLEIDGLYSALLPKKSLHSQEQDEYHAPDQNRSGYQKVFPNSIKPLSTYTKLGPKHIL